MNACDILRYGHRDVLAAFEGLTPEQWSRVGVTTRWSPRDLAAHLASFERLLEDALASVVGEGATPTLDAMRRDSAGFNQSQVDARRDLGAEQVMREYAQAHEGALALAERLGPERLASAGTIPWYGAGYALDDFIVYANYGHKREHCAQMRAFRARGA